jgi:hypothetical protein
MKSRPVVRAKAQNAGRFYKYSYGAEAPYKTVLELLRYVYIIALVKDEHKCSDILFGIKEPTG